MASIFSLTSGQAGAARAAARFPVSRNFAANSDKLNVLGVAVWDKVADTEKAIKDLDITWPVILDAQQIPTDIYGISGIPCIMLIAPTAP